MPFASKSGPVTVEIPIPPIGGLDRFIGQPLTTETVKGIHQQTGSWVLNNIATNSGTVLNRAWVQQVNYDTDVTNGSVTGTITLAADSLTNYTDATSVYGQSQWVDVDPRLGYGPRVTWHQWVTDNRSYDNQATFTPINYGYTVRSNYVWIPDKKAEFKDKIRRQLSESQHLNHLGRTRRSHAPGADFNSVKANEITALHLLRKMTDSDTFRRYLKSGVLSVRGPSGLFYAIHRNSHFVDVYYNQRHVSKLCVYVPNKYQCPPTDDVIAKMITIECDEPEIWRKSNWHILPNELKEIACVKDKVTARTLLKLVA